MGDDLKDRENDHFQRGSAPRPDRPLIVPEFQGRSKDDHVVAVSLTENRYFGHFLNRPPIDTISNIYVRWGTIEDDDMTPKKIYIIFYELASF